MGGINELYKSENIEAFKMAFSQRYENQYVPLSEVLDEEIGIGYPVGNIRNSNADGCFDEVVTPVGGGGASFQGEGSLNGFYNYLLNKITKLNVTGSTILELSSNDLKEFVTNKVKLPPTFSVYCSVLAESKEQIDSGDYKVVLSNSSQGNGDTTRSPRGSEHPLPGSRRGHFHIFSKFLFS